MKKMIVVMCLTCIGQSIQAQEGTFTVGFLLEMTSKGGFIFGYNLTDDLGVELHFGTVPGTITYGVTAKVRIREVGNDQYALLGLTRFTGTLPHTEVPWHTGLNIGYRYEFRSKKYQRVYPVEIGVCPTLWTTSRDPDKDSDFNYVPFSIFIGAGVQWLLEGHGQEFVRPLNSLLQTAEADQEIPPQ